MKIIFLFSSLLLTISATQPKFKIQYGAVTRQGNTITAKITVVPMGEYILNLEAPWTLTVPDTEGWKSVKNPYTREDFSPDSGSFLVRGKAVGPKAVPYQLVVFTCTKDKKTCFRDIQEGKLRIP